MIPGLFASQRAWLAYREAECGMMNDQWSGEGSRGGLNGWCEINLTRQRIRELQLRAAQKLFPKPDH